MLSRAIRHTARQVRPMGARGMSAEIVNQVYRDVTDPSLLVLEMNGPEETSCTKTYLIADQASKRALILDPVKCQLNRYLAVLGYYNCELEAAVDTHNHADHTTATSDLKGLTGCNIVVSEKSPRPFADRYVADGDGISLADRKLDVLYTPGHTPDHIALYDGRHVFTGDLLLIGGTGRTDFAGGDAGTSFDSIQDKIFTLPDDTIVLPGHDYRGHTCSTVGDEKATNPRLAGKSRDDYVAIMNDLGLPLPEHIMESIQVNAGAVTDERADQMQGLPSFSQLAEVSQLSADQLAAAIADEQRLSGMLLLDVRTPQEFSEGHIKGAVHIPVTELAQRVEELEQHRSKEVVCICRAGMRSTTAAAILRGSGFTNTHNLTGGMIAWQDAGY